MTDELKRGSRFKLVRDVIVFQIKLGLEAALDIMLIPVSLAAAAVDLVFGNWRRPRWFHTVLRFGERCERRIELWRVAPTDGDTSEADVDAVIRSIETLMRQPGTGGQKVRELRRWAAARLAPGGDDGPRPSKPDDDPGS